MFIEIIRDVARRNGWISVAFGRQVGLHLESIAGTSVRFRREEFANLHIPRYVRVFSVAAVA